MKKILGIVATLLFCATSQAQVYNLFGPANGVLKGSTGTYQTTTATGTDIPAAGANTQVQYNNSGVMGASGNFTWNSGSNILNLGASTTPGTFSVGSLGAMTISGVALAVPSFASNSNIQGNIELHSFVTSPASAGSLFYGVRARGTISAPTTVVNGDSLLQIGAAGYDGTGYTWGAHIHFQADGTPSAGVLPGAIDFQTTPAASNTPVSRLLINSTGTFIVGGATGSSGQFLQSAGAGAAATWATLPGSFTGFANPTATLGLTAVNGSATTAMRSDAAPALSQAIVPTWTGAHTFSGNPVTLTAATPTKGILLTDSAAALNAKTTNVNNAGGTLTVSSVTDAGAVTTNLLSSTRTGAAWSTLNFGNATDNPAYQFLGTGTLTAAAFVPSSASAPTNGMYLSAANTLGWATNSAARMTLDATANLVANGNVTGAALIPSGSTVPVNGDYLPAANTLGWSTASTQRGTLNSAGNWVMLAPSSGNTLQIGGVTGGTAVNVINSTSGSGSEAFFAMTNNTDANLVFSISQAGAASKFSSFGPSTATALNLVTGGSTRLSASGTGNVTINAPGSGTALTVNSASAAVGQYISAGAGQGATLGFQSNASAKEYRIGAVTSATTFDIYDNTAGASRMSISTAGAVTFPSVSTTASAANAFLDNAAGNNLLRSTSSIRYKQDVHTMPLDVAERAIDKLRPITYRSKAAADDPKEVHFGFIAEEVDEVEPRLVQYTTMAGVKVPDGVQYDRMTVILMAEVQELRKQNKAMTQRLKNLEAINAARGRSANDATYILQSTASR
jgi:hypothetical protein